MMALSKTIRVLGVVVMMLIFVVLCSILIFDPPPFRLRDEDKFVLSVEPPHTIDRNLAPSIERGLACQLRPESVASDDFGRPVITLFDWLKRQSGAAPKPDYHLVGTKRNDAWAIKIDRTTNKFCWLRASDAEAGITDAYCGPSIIREDATRIEAFDNNNYVAVAVDKMTYTIIITSLDRFMHPPRAAIWYLECH
jgi:hypothetical protein